MASVDAVCLSLLAFWFLTRPVHSTHIDKEAFKKIKLSEFGSTSDPQVDPESVSPSTAEASAMTTALESSYHLRRQRVHLSVLRTHGSRSGSESPHELDHEHELEHDHDHEHDHEYDHDHDHDSPCTNDGRKRRIGSTVSASDSQFSDSPTPGPVHSPIQSQMSDVHMRRSPQSHPRSLSPRETSQTRHAAPRRAGNGNGSTHVSLPSLSDMFDKRQLSPTSLTPPAANPEPASISSAGNGSASSYSTNGYPRTPMDGSLPIHALLSGKPTSPNPHLASSQTQGHYQFQLQQPSQYPNQHHAQHHAQHQHQHQHHAPHPSHRAASPGHSAAPQAWSYAQVPAPERQPRFNDFVQATDSRSRSGSTQYPSYS